MAILATLVRRCLSSIVLILAMMGDSQADDWPQWLGPRRDGSTLEKVAPWKEDRPPKVLWKQEISQAYSSPIVAGGRVYLHSGIREKDVEEVTAYDLATGKVVWKDNYPRPRYRSVLGTGPRATPTLAGKQLFAFGINGVLTCYDVPTGKRAWQVNLFEELQAPGASPDVVP